MTSSSQVRARFVSSLTMSGCSVARFVDSSGSSARSARKTRQRVTPLDRRSPVKQCLNETGCPVAPGIKIETELRPCEDAAVETNERDPSPPGQSSRAIPVLVPGPVSAQKLFLPLLSTQHRPLIGHVLLRSGAENNG